MLEAGSAALVETTTKGVLDRRRQGEIKRAQDFERRGVVWFRPAG